MVHRYQYNTIGWKSFAWNFFKFDFKIDDLKECHGRKQVQLIPCTVDL